MEFLHFRLKGLAERNAVTGLSALSGIGQCDKYACVFAHTPQGCFGGFGGKNVKIYFLASTEVPLGKKNPRFVDFSTLG